MIIRRDRIGLSRWQHMVHIHRAESGLVEAEGQHSLPFPDKLSMWTDQR